MILYYTILLKKDLVLDWFKKHQRGQVDHIHAGTGLPDTVDPPDALIEPGRIPGQLEVEHAVRSLQIEPCSPGVGGQKDLALRIVGELVDQGLPFVHRDLAA